MNLALLALRVVVGALFAGHGAQKLFGSFGGHGPEGTGGFFESLGLKPGKPMAIAAGASEFFGGILVALGLLTPVGALLITSTMVVAIVTAHWSKGVWNTDGGYELNLLVIAVVFALAGAGSGEWSLDHALGLDVSGTEWALGQLALGIAGAAATIAAGRRGLLARRTGSATPTTA